MLQRRPRLAYPFTILTSPNTIRLVAGEDFRYTLTAPDLDRWLPPLLERFLGKETLQTLCAALTPPQREAALQVIQHLYGERVLVDGSANDAHVAQKYHIVIEGSGGLQTLMAGSNPSPPAPLPQGERGALLRPQGLILWKLHEAEREFPDPALYRLHVLEREHFEVSTHRVFIDPLCPECGRERR